MSVNEYDVAFESTHVRFLEGGAGFPVLLLHGSGPGVSTRGNYRKVLDQLAARYHVLAMDWVGFGDSGRRSAPPYFDMAMWERQVAFALARMPGQRLGIVAHSLAAALALKAAASEGRVAKLLTTGAMGTAFKANEYLRTVWTFPETRQDVRKAVECLVYDRTLITDEFVENRFQVLQRGDYPAYFSSMFSGDKQRYIDASVLPASLLADVRCEVLMLHGRDDLPIPFEETTLVLARQLPNADVWVLARCGHSPALEHPDKVLAAAQALFG